MDLTQQTDAEQKTLWNGLAGRGWADSQEMLDRMCLPIENLLTTKVSGTRVLDVGCGAGGTTLAVARELGATGSCTGIDIAEPMIEVARTRAVSEGSAAQFIQADAQRYEFGPASFDTIISRFGVMFFDDPVRAFTNLRSAATEGAELAVIAWRSAADNPFMTTAETAARPLLPNLPVRQPDEPGQFGFGNRDLVHSILDKSGWVDIDIQPVDIEIAMPEPELVPYLTRLGPVGRALQVVDDETRERVIDTIRPAFDPYIHAEEVRITAACWMIGARSS